MLRFTLGLAGSVVLCLGLVADTGLALREPAVPATPEMAIAPAAGTLSPEAQNAVLGRFCFRCHNNDLKTGGLTLESFDVAHAEQNAEVAEKMIRKLRAGMMPPSYAQRPDPAIYEALIAALEAPIDEAAAANPNPGSRTFQRLNRTEYARSIRDLLGIDVDVAAFLPPDTISHGFDNIADVQTLSATLMDGYLRAASEISRLAVGDPDASPSETTYKAPKTASQMGHLEGAPFGTRGGISVVHNFPADGEYIFKIYLHPGPTGFLYGMTARGEQIEVSVDGERMALLDIDPFISESDPKGLALETEPIVARAGRRRVSAAFIQRFEGPVNDLIAPIEYTLADSMIGAAYGITTLPHVRDFTIRGPYNVTGVSDTPSRREIFTCRPTSPGDEMSCAREIISRLSAQAYRRPATAEDLEDLMSFYETGATEGNFESGIRMALKAILASPHFVFRLEETPASVRSGETYRINDLDLASRLSYFLWATGPDAELVTLASAGELSDPEVLETQARRMLADARSEALATRFAAQWLRLQDLDKLHPDALKYPQWDHRLVEAMRRETELLFDHLVREDRSLLELLTADYTFVNERLSEHYGIPDVAGTRFRRVELNDEGRRGLLGHGSILALTSHANRTSPVLRGKWVMEVLIGIPPPPPPPNIPDLEETNAAVGTRLLTVRERMEEHRSNPACTSCHSVIDPIGLALENFDVTGAWRIRDNGAPIDASGELYDGSVLNGPADLRQALLNYSGSFITTFTENLMAYSLGRRIEYYDMPPIRAIVREAERNDYRMSSFILGVVKSAAFQKSRQVELTDLEADSTEGH